MDTLPRDVLLYLSNKLIIGKLLQFSLTCKRIHQLITEKFSLQIYDHHKNRGQPSSYFLTRILRLIPSTQIRVFLEVLTFELLKQHPTWWELKEPCRYILQNNGRDLSIVLHGWSPLITLDTPNNSPYELATTRGCPYSSIYYKEFQPLLDRLYPPKFRKMKLSPYFDQPSIGQILDSVFHELRPTKALSSALVEILIDTFISMWEQVDTNVSKLELQNWSFQINKSKLTILKDAFIFYECEHIISKQVLTEIQQEKPYIPKATKDPNLPKHKYLIYTQTNPNADKKGWGTLWSISPPLSYTIKKHAITDANKIVQQAFTRTRVVVIKSVKNILTTTTDTLPGPPVYFSTSLDGFGVHTVLLSKHGRTSCMDPMQ